jgi:hypothetical protein
MPIEFSIITAAGGALIGIAGTGAYFFSKGYAQRAGANAADKTPYIKSETINKSNKEGNLRIVEKWRLSEKKSNSFERQKWNKRRFIRANYPIMREFLNLSKTKA